jgi:adenylate cyclase
VAAGRELGTELVLDGALQRSADRLRINVSLVRVADGLTVWADRFDVRWTDVFRVQDAIAEQVGRV